MYIQKQELTRRECGKTRIKEVTHTVTRETYTIQRHCHCRLILPRSMDPDAALHLEVAAVVVVALLVVAVAVVGSGACACDDAGTRGHVDIEHALGEGTLMTYEQAAKKPPPSPEEQQKEEECCAICLSEYSKADELVRVVPACGHFFHAKCDVDRWLRTRRTCPLCRGGLCPPLPRPECCPPMPPRASRATVAIVVV